MFRLPLALSLLACAAAYAQEDMPVELRAAWINAWDIDTPAHRETILRKIQAAQLNTVLVNAPPLGGNWSYGKQEDFAAFVQAAHGQGLAVHGWIMNHHRKGLDKKVDFADPAEQQAQVAWAALLLETFPVLDGVHLDYIRYPDWAACDAAKIAGVNATVRQIHAMLREKYPGKFLTASVFTAAAVNYRGQWTQSDIAANDAPIMTAQWEGAVPEWYRDYYAAKPDNYYSLRYRDDPKLHQDWLIGPSFFCYQQDPVTWMREGYVDAIFPMQYTASIQTWKREADQWREFLGEKADHVYLGLGWITEKEHPDWAYDAGAVVWHIQYGRAVGLRGFSIFTLYAEGPHDEELIQALTADGPVNLNHAPYKNPARSPLKN